MRPPLLPVKLPSPRRRGQGPQRADEKPARNLGEGRKLPQLLQITTEAQGRAHMTRLPRVEIVAQVHRQRAEPTRWAAPDPILDAPRTVLTPHMGWQTIETFRRAATMSVDNILRYFSGGPIHIANPEALKVLRPRSRPSC